MNGLHESDLIKVIEAHTGHECYLDIIPDTSDLPACAVTNIGPSPMTQRVLSGGKVGDVGEQRVSLVASSMGELDSLVKSFELLDNTSNEYFRKIRVDFSSREPFDGQTNVFRVFYNLTSVR